VADKGNNFTGILVLDKPGLPQFEEDAAGFRGPPTSHDIVQWVRRRTGQQRIGHTGTLDPFASGVLVLCLGQATRLVEYYQGHNKTYWARVVLGTATNTYDGQGEVTDSAPLPDLDRAGIEAVLADFRGPIQQIPPIYSAIKQGGESVHYKARRGEDVVMVPRPVTIHRLDLLEIHTQDGRPWMLDLRITGSAGTYIRSLAYDLGWALGSAGHLSVLRREQAGFFSLEYAKPLADLAHLTRNDDWNAVLLPMGFGLDMPALTLDAETVQRFGFGQKVIFSATDAQLAEGAIAQAIGPDGDFLGTLASLGPSQEEGGTVWKPAKWFAT